MNEEMEPELLNEPEVTDVEGEKPKKRRMLIIATVIVALILIGFWLSYRPAPNQVQGMVEAREIRISSKVTGRIEEIFVQDGQPVRSGDLLYSISSPEVAAKTQQAEGALAAAQAQEDKADAGARAEDIAAARAQWQRAQAAADLAQDTSTRTQRLYREGVLARQKADEARTNAIASSQAALAAKAQYDAAVSGSRPQDRAAARGQVEQARGAVAEVAAAEQETQIRSPADGELGQRLAEPGELVPQGFPVFTLTQTQSPWVTITIREDQLNGLKRGQQVTGSVPALEMQEARFVVDYLAPAGDFATWRATRQSTGFDVKSFEVRLRPAKRIEGLRPGMTVLFDWSR